MRAFKLGGRAAKLGSVVAVVVGLTMGLGGSAGLGGTAGAATDANYAFARTQGNFGLTWGFPGINFHATFGTKSAVNVSFHVNGQAYGRGSFSVPAEAGPNLADPSSANASSSYCQGCLTNAIAINVDVITGPAGSVFVPTNAVAKDTYCVGCNTLAADYTFVVAPGTVAALTSTGLSDLYGIASTVVADANTVEPSQVLAEQVITELQAIQTLLNGPELDPVGSPQAALAAPVPQVQTQHGVQVQEFGNTQFSTAVTG
jgi:hypothetical protein